MGTETMTDADLSARVAKECFGWHVDGPDWRDADDQWIAAICDEFADGSNWWSPLENASDAERVWDWLREKGMIVIERRPNGANATVLIRSLNVVKHGEWKRALCLAALEVARAHS